MGYTTRFTGSFKIDRPLAAGHHAFLRALVDDDERKHRPIPAGYPDAYCQWEPTPDGTAIRWDGGEKFYEYEEWLRYICARLDEWGYKLNGRVPWAGEEVEDVGVLVVEDNRVTAVRGLAAVHGAGAEVGRDDLARFLCRDLSDRDARDAAERILKHFAVTVRKP